MFRFFCRLVRERWYPGQLLKSQKLSISRFLHLRNTAENTRVVSSYLRTIVIERWTSEGLFEPCSFSIAHLAYHIIFWQVFKVLCMCEWGNWKYDNLRLTWVNSQRFWCFNRLRPTNVSSGASTTWLQFIANHRKESKGEIIQWHDKFHDIKRAKVQCWWGRYIWY